MICLKVGEAGGNSECGFPEVLMGEQIAIVDRWLFDAVQARLDAQINGHKVARSNSEALLSGRGCGGEVMLAQGGTGSRFGAISGDG